MNHILHFAFFLIIFSSITTNASFQQPNQHTIQAALRTAMSATPTLNNLQNSKQSLERIYREGNSNEILEAASRLKCNIITATRSKDALSRNANHPVNNNTLINTFDTELKAAQVLLEKTKKRFSIH